MALTFRINLTLLPEETFGPGTNSRVVGVLPPDFCTSSPSRGMAEREDRKTRISTWLPGYLAAQNVALKHGAVFTVTDDVMAVYLRDQYAKGYAPNERAWLEVVL